MAGRGALAVLMLLGLAACCGAAEFTEDGMEIVKHIIVDADEVARTRGGARRLLGAPDPARTLTAPVNCGGWPQQRVYMEVQSWFTRPGDDVDTMSSHLHIGACLPHRQTINGDITLHLLVQKHLLPGNSTFSTPVAVSIEFTNQVTKNTVTKYTVNSNALALKTAPWVCSANATLCKAVLPLVVPTYSTTVFTPDGPQKMTLIASIGGFNDGKTKGRSMQAKLDSWVTVNNTGTQTAGISTNQSLPIENLVNTQFPWGYTHAHFTSNFTVEPVSGTWNISFMNFIAGNAAKTANVTGVFVSIDPNFHNTQLPDFTGKKILVDVDATATPINCPVKKGHIDCAWKNLPIVTDDGTLNDGTHKLFIRTDSFVSPANSIMIASPFNGGTFSSVLMLAFKVCNNPPCAADVISDDPQDNRPPLPAMNPPPGATWYNGTQATPAVGDTIANPYDCSGWMGNRTYLEGQTWLTPPGNDVTNSSQLHVGACVPHKQMVAGQVPLQVLLSKFNFPSYANTTVSLRITFFWNGGNVSFELSQTGSQKGWACQDRAPLCRSVYVTMIDTRPPDNRWMIPDGLNLVEIMATVTIFDGVTPRSLSARVESYTIVANTGPTTLTKPLAPSVTTKTFFPWGSMNTALLTELPLTPVTGNIAIQAALTGSAHTGANVTGVFAAIDPLPMLRPDPFLGAILFAESAPVINASQPIPLPYTTTNPAASCVKRGGDLGSATCTATLVPSTVGRSCLNPCDGGLCDGVHRLFIRTDSFVDPSHPMFRDLPPEGQVGAGTLSDVLVVPITTSNGIQPSSLCSAKKLTTNGFAAAAVSTGSGQGPSGPLLGRRAGPPTVGGGGDGEDGLMIARAAGVPGVAGAAVDAASVGVRTAVGGAAAEVIVAKAKLVAAFASTPEDDSRRADAFS